MGGSSSVGRASAFQAEGREFEPRLPLQPPQFRAGLIKKVRAAAGPRSSGVERLLGKEAQGGMTHWTGGNVRRIP
jgi:hypothetical protein